MKYPDVVSHRTDIYWAIVILVTIVVFITVFLSRWYRLYRQPIFSLTDSQVVYLHRSTDLEGLAAKLDTLGLLQQKKEFYWSGRLLGWEQFRKGRYQLSPQITYNKLFAKLGRGIQDPLHITVLPGTSLGQFQRHLANRFAFDTTAIKQLFRDSTFLKNKSLSKQQLFGRMLPNTYQFYWTASPKRVINEILAHFQEKVARLFRDRLEKIQFNLNEIIALAAIIEWEANKESEKKIISGLYWNRLKRGMRLQADPTVLFALDKRRRLYFKDYKVQHPYNTYIHRGLPPGPITNPSLSSIKAALYPAQHDYLYMVATPKGTHLFSETYEKHKQKSREWRKWIQKQYRLKRKREKTGSKHNKDETR